MRLQTVRVIRLQRMILFLSKQKKKVIMAAFVCISAISIFQKIPCCNLCRKIKLLNQFHSPELNGRKKYSNRVNIAFVFYTTTTKTEFGIPAILTKNFSRR